MEAEKLHLVVLPTGRHLLFFFAQITYACRPWTSAFVSLRPGEWIVLANMRRQTNHLVAARRHCAAVAAECVAKCSASLVRAEGGHGLRDRDVHTMTYSQRQRLQWPRAYQHSTYSREDM